MVSNPVQTSAGQGEEKDFDTIDLNSIETEEVKELGSEWLCYQAVEQLGIRKFLEQQGWDADRIDIALIHLISKAVYPLPNTKQNNGYRRTARWPNFFL